MDRNAICLLAAIVLFAIGLFITCDWLISGNAEAFLFGGLIAFAASFWTWKPAA
jgi:hypothetical protein